MNLISRFLSFINHESKIFFLYNSRLFIYKGEKQNFDYNDSAFVNVFRANVIKIGNSYLDNVSSRDVYKCGIIVVLKVF